MKIYWSGDSKNIIGAKVRAAIGKEMVAARFGDKSAAARLRMLRPHHPPHRKRRPLCPRLRSQSPRQGLQRFLRIPIRRLKRSLRERFHYFIRGERSNAAFRKQSVAVLLSLAPHEVRRGCDRSRLAGIHGEAMYTAPNSAGRAALQATICQCKISLGGLKGGYSLLKESIPLFPFIRAVPSALLFPLHAQREKPPLICKDKKTTPRCCEFLRSAIRQR